MLVWHVGAWLTVTRHQLGQVSPQEMMVLGWCGPPRIPIVLPLIGDEDTARAARFTVKAPSLP